MISTEYDPHADALYLRLAPRGARPTRTEEVAPGLMLDFDAEGRVIGVEVLSLRLRAAGAYPADDAAAQKPAAAE